MSDTPDPRDLLRAHIEQLEARASQLDTELEEVRSELKQYRTALAALTGKPAKKSVTRALVHRELVAILTEAPSRAAARAELETSVRNRLKSSGHKLNGIARRFEEAIQDEAFSNQNGTVSLVSDAG